MTEREELNSQAQFVSGEIREGGRVVGYYEVVGEGAAMARVKTLNFPGDRNPATPPIEMDPVAAGYRTKTCGKCGETMRISEFYRCTKASDGHQAWCKQCQKDNDKQRRGKPVQRGSWLSRIWRNLMRAMGAR